MRSCLCPPLLPLAFKASFLQLFLIYSEPEEWVIADQKTGLFCYPIKNTHGDNVLPVPPCDQRGSTNALCFTHFDAHVGVGISKLEVGSHRWYNKRQFFSFILFLRRVLVVVQASCSGVLISSWSHSDKPLCQRRGLCRYLRAWGENFFIIIIPNNGAHTGTEMGHKWIIYFVFICFLTPLSLRSIFRRCKEAFHYCAFDKVVAELCSCSAQGRFKS